MVALAKERGVRTELTKEMRRTAGRVIAERSRQMKKLLRLRRIRNDKRLPIDWRSDAGRLADRLKQELADFAEMRIGVGVKS
jgi:hypothetical protein